MNFLLIIGVIGLCYLSYLAGQLHSQIKSQSALSNIVYGKDDANDNSVNLHGNPENQIVNLTNIRPVIQLNKESYHIGDRL